jgi:hypothetical protein
VFAPTDAAFTALLAELKLTKAQLLADKTLLRVVPVPRGAGAVPGRRRCRWAGDHARGRRLFKIDAQGSGSS